MNLDRLYLYLFCGIQELGYGVSPEMPVIYGPVYLQGQILQGPERVQFERRKKQGMRTAFCGIKFDDTSTRKQSYRLV